MARHNSTWRLASATLGILVATACTTQNALGQYTFVNDTDNSGNWVDPALWSGGPAGTFPNGAGVKVTINAPFRTGGSGNYNLFVPEQTPTPPAINITVGEITIDNTLHSNNFRSNFASGGGRLIFQSTSGAAKYTETIGSAPGATNSQYQFLMPVDLLSDLLISQDNYPNLNTGTTFAQLVTGGSNRTITKTGHGGIQFNYNHLPTETPFQGQVVINQGGIRLITVNPFINVSGVTVNSGGQLMLADNGQNTMNTDWDFAPGAVLNLNGAGKATDTPQTVSNPEGALRITVGQITSTNVNNPVVLQSDSVISVPTATITGTLTNTVTGAGGLTKHGDGTLVLSSAGTSYGGDTHILTAPGMAAVNTLSFTNPVLPDGRDVHLSETRTALNLNFGATDTVRSLFVDGVGQPVGTYGATDNLSVLEAFRKPFITGGGLLEVTTLTSLEDADFNNDDFIDGADFLIWQRNFGGSGALAQGDANGDTLINDVDFAIWKEQFGGAGSVAAGAAVPEPAASALLILGLASMVAGRCRRLRRG